jgi:hypothetical protein
MFSTASRMPVSCSRSATPSMNPAAYSRCHRNGGCSTTVSAPTSTARSMDRSIFTQGSLPQTRCVTSSVGAWIDRIRMPCSSASARSAPASRVSGSVQTMISTPS